MPSKNTVENKKNNKNSSYDLNQQKNKIGKKGHAISTIIGIISVLLMIMVISGGVTYLMIKNDVNGVATKNRNAIIKIPILKSALPKPKDPEDPKYLSTTELIEKYNELKKTRDQLTNELNEAKKKISELQKFKDKADSVTASQAKTKSELEALKKKLDEEAIQNAEDKKKIDELIVSGDKEGFKEYFEKVNKETAEKMYKEILEEEKASDEIKKLVKLYEGMDASEAAEILTEMQTEQFDIVVKILKNMNSSKASEIIAALEPEYAAKITVKLAEINNKSNQ